MAQEHRRWKVRQVLERQRFQQIGPERREDVQWQHLTGDEKVQRVDNVQKRCYFQNPEADHADAGFEEETDEESEDKRHEISRPRNGVEPAEVEVVTVDKEEQAVRQRRR